MQALLADISLLHQFLIQLFILWMQYHTNCVVSPLDRPPFTSGESTQRLSHIPAEWSRRLIRFLPFSDSAEAPLLCPPYEKEKSNKWTQLSLGTSRLLFDKELLDYCIKNSPTLSTFNSSYFLHNFMATRMDFCPFSKLKTIQRNESFWKYRYISTHLRTFWGLTYLFS